MGDVWIGGVGGVESDNSGSIEILDLFKIRQAYVVYQITRGYVSPEGIRIERGRAYSVSLMIDIG